MLPCPFRFCRRCELFKKQVRVVFLAVEDVAYALFSRRRFAAGVCRKGGKEKIVELGMVRHDCGDSGGSENGAAANIGI